MGFYIGLAHGAHTASAFKRIMRPQGVALPIINLAVWLVRRAECIEDIHIAVGPGSSTPFRARAAEAALRGTQPDGEAVSSALEALLGEVKFRTSPRRAGAEYRRHLVDSLFKDTLAAAWQRTE